MDGLHARCGEDTNLSLSEKGNPCSNESKPQAEDPTEDVGGWTYEFVDVVEKDFECNVCLLPLKNPFMTRCGHSMCKTCLDKHLEKYVLSFVTFSSCLEYSLAKPAIHVCSLPCEKYVLSFCDYIIFIFSNAMNRTR